MRILITAGPTREAIDPLRYLSNRSSGKMGYAIASAALASLVLFATYTEELAAIGKHITFDLSNPYVVAGLFLGGLLPYIFSALSMEAVGETAGIHSWRLDDPPVQVAI